MPCPNRLHHGDDDAVEFYILLAARGLEQRRIYPFFRTVH